MYKISKYNQICRVKNSNIVHDNAEIDWPKVNLFKSDFKSFKNKQTKTSSDNWNFSRHT